MNFLKKSIPAMQMQKRAVKQMLGTRTQHDIGTQKMLSSLMKYEDVGLAFYAFEDQGMRVLTHPNIENLQQKVEESCQAQKNPYTDTSVWIKGEYLDLMGMLDCLQGREIVMGFQLQLEKKIVSDMNSMEANKAGKTTLKNFWKSKESKGKKAMELENQIEAQKKEIDDYKQLINFLTLYHGHMAIPAFKANKRGLYLKMLNSFCMKEISNAHSTATLFHGLLDPRDKQGGQEQEQE